MALKIVIIAQRTGIQVSNLKKRKNIKTIMAAPFDIQELININVKLHKRVCIAQKLDGFDIYYFHFWDDCEFDKPKLI